MSSVSPARSSTSKPIRILIVDDHPLFRQGLWRVLEGEPDFRMIGEAANGTNAVGLALSLQPDIILMDINLPGKNGLEITQEIRKHSLSEAIGIIILTAYHDDEQLIHALQAGAAAYFPKDVLPNTLIGAIRAVADNHYVIAEEVMTRPQMARWLLRHLREGELPGELHRSLTPREMEVLRCITRGASNKEIARSLHISQQTVKNHMSNILQKLTVADRTQAAMLALRRGWVRLEDTVH